MKFFTSKLLARSNISRMLTSTLFLYFAVIDGPINIFIIILYSFKLLIAPAQTRSIKVRYFAAY